MPSRIADLLRAPPRRAVRTAMLAALVAGLLLIGAGIALAMPPPAAAITGEPTIEEAEIVADTWREFTNLFAPKQACMGPVEVRIVGRAEDWYGGRSFGSISAFYRFPPEAIVFIEHGKVSPENLLHEFAHHLDISCGVGASIPGRAFLSAQGFDPDASWLEGPSWPRVPAEGFAEAVVAVFGLQPSIPIERGALWAVWELAATPARLGVRVPASLGRLEWVDLARILTTAGGSVAAL